MLIQASSILNMPVGAIDLQSKIGTTKKIVVNHEDGNVLALVVSTGGLFSKEKILSTKDILDFDKNGIVTKSEENLLDIDEISRVKKILEENITVIGQNAFTKSKKKLGKINDLLIDLGSFFVLKYYIHGFFEDKILPSDKVVKITKEGVFFSNDVIEKSSLPEVESAAA